MSYDNETMVGMIRHLRWNPEDKKKYVEFFNYVAKNINEVQRETIRWKVSVMDTIADFEDKKGAVALFAVIFAFMEKVFATIEAGRWDNEEFCKGLETCGGTPDVWSNLVQRMRKHISCPVMMVLFDSVIRDMLSAEQLQLGKFNSKMPNRAKNGVADAVYGIYKAKA